MWRSSQATAASRRQGETLFTLKGVTGTVHVAAPLTGRIEHGNAGLKTDPGELIHSPYDRGWVCLMTPSDLATGLSSLKIGKPVIDWYQEEITRLRTPNGPQATDVWLRGHQPPKPSPAW